MRGNPIGVDFIQQLQIKLGTIMICTCKKTILKYSPLTIASFMQDSAIIVDL